MQHEATIIAPAIVTEAAYTAEDAKTMTGIDNAGVTLKVFIFAAILLCINAVAYL